MTDPTGDRPYTRAQRLAIYAGCGLACAGCWWGLWLALPGGWL